MVCVSDVHLLFTSLFLYMSPFSVLLQVDQLVMFMYILAKTIK